MHEKEREEELSTCRVYGNIWMQVKFQWLSHTSSGTESAKNALPGLNSAHSSPGANSTLCAMESEHVIQSTRCCGKMKRFKLQRWKNIGLTQICDALKGPLTRVNLCLLQRTEEEMRQDEQHTTNIYAPHCVCRLPIAPVCNRNCCCTPSISFSDLIRNMKCKFGTLVLVTALVVLVSKSNASRTTPKSSDAIVGSWYLNLNGSSTLQSSLERDLFILSSSGNGYTAVYIRCCLFFITLSYLSNRDDGTQDKVSSISYDANSGSLEFCRIGTDTDGNTFYEWFSSRLLEGVLVGRFSHSVRFHFVSSFLFISK